MVEKFIIIAKTKLDNIFLRYQNSEKRWMYNVMSLSGSALATLLLSIITTETYQPVWIFSAHTRKSLSGVIFFFIIVFWGYLKWTGKLKDLNGLEKDIENENLYSEDYTYILLIPKLTGEKLLFPVIQKDTWENSLFFPYLKHNNGNNNISLHEIEIAKEICAKYSIPIPIRIKEIATEGSTVTKLKDGIPKDFHFRFLYVSSLSPFFRNYFYKQFILK